MPSQLQTIEQKRAASAWAVIKPIKEKQSDDFKKKYSGLARSMPAMMQNAGLGQALAFLRAKAGQDHSKAEWHLYGHLSDWIKNQGNTSAFGEKTLLDWLIEQSSEQYRQVTAEIIGYLRWLKRFAEAELPEPEDGGNK